MPHLKPPELKEQQAARSMKRFDHRTVVVTGGACGMGASHARGFVAEGANVVIADVLEQEGRTLAHELGGVASHFVGNFDGRSFRLILDYPYNIPLRHQAAFLS